MARRRPHRIISTQAGIGNLESCMSDEIDDDQLMIGLQSGDSRAFEALVERYQQRLISFFFTNTRDHQFSEDLTQETLLRVHDQAWDYLPTGRFRGWMYRIARNLLIDNIRRRSHDALVRSVRGTGDENCVLASLAEEITSPHDAADQRELAALVDELLTELPEEQRLTFTLHHFGSLSLPEVADIMHSSTATTKSRLRLAREKLREKLSARGVEG
jgi:RNA polymerase sigma-70 factor (ECF subfamily)